jgi:hypothetical protein
MLVCSVLTPLPSKANGYVKGDRYQYELNQACKHFRLLFSAFAE